VIVDGAQGKLTFRVSERVGEATAAKK